MFFVYLHPQSDILKIQAMIQELKIKNFLSFKEEAVLNFEATKDTTFEEYQVVEVAPGTRLLRFALIYGANASGKSNLLYALDYLQRFWFAKKNDIDESTDSIPFLLDTDTPEQPSEFEMKFFVGERRYWYILSLSQKNVLSEKLYYYKSVQPTMLFSRELENGQSVIKFNPTALKVSNNVLEQITIKCLPNMSFFAARNQVNCTLPFIDDARDWMKNTLLPVISPQIQMFSYAGTMLANDNNLKKYLLDFVHKADFNITGLKAERENNPIPQAIKDSVIKEGNYSKEVAETIMSQLTLETIRTDFEHTVRNARGVEKYILPNSLQSDGTKRTFGIEAAVYRSLKGEKFLPVDEIDSSLHPDLVEFIIQQFLQTHNRSQLLVTSHYDPLLNTVDDLMRKDCVWFTEKGEDGGSRLYSLVEFKGLNKISSFQKSYRNGVFGALPNIIG